jgi:hypothetical protein
LENENGLDTDSQFPKLKDKRYGTPTGTKRNTGLYILVCSAKEIERIGLKR